MILLIKKWLCAGLIIKHIAVSAQPVQYEVPQINGSFVHIFDPNENSSRGDSSWYTNDHAFAKASDGTWHAFGIIHHLPIAPWKETRFFHITAKSLVQSKWNDEGYAMTAAPGVERVLWAPYIFKEKRTCYMFYNTGNMQVDAPDYASWGQLRLATSSDFYRWQRHESNPLFSDPGHARDSYIMKYKGTYYYYYTRVFSETDFRSVVAVRTGPDLLHWSGPRIVHTQPYKVYWGGDAESPFVVHKNGLFYLFICRAMTSYNLTEVYWSKDPLNFPIENLVCALPVHAAEIIYDKKEGWFISNTGWDKKGLYIAPLQWKPAKAEVNTNTIQPKPNISIVWDSSTLRKVSSSGKRYCGYARLIVLPDKSWLCTYEADGNVVVSKSADSGMHWSAPVVVAARGNGYNMAVPDLLLLQDGAILICYNPRPYQISPERKFSIRTKKSYDGGVSWTDERLLYEAGHEFKNGCWESSAIQLPNGEIQLFFANEGIYTQSDEQNISLLRSTDNGLSWSAGPAMASFRAGSRDGMPVPLLLKNGEEIVFAIEDNGPGNFKPYIIRNTLSENWSVPVLGAYKNRSAALSEKIPDSLYAGAPYLRQLPSGETILSYQGTEGRPNRMQNAEMKVVVGSAEATGFSQKTVPFNIPLSKYGLWNSLSVIDNNTVVAFTSTNAYATDDATEVWMIIGRMVRKP